MNKKLIENLNPIIIIEGFANQKENRWYLLFLINDHQRIDWFFNLN